MEFSSRAFQRNNTRPTIPTAAGDPQNSDTQKKPVHKRAVHKIKSNTVLSSILFVSGLILVIAVILGISTKSSENSLVQKNRYQAVFLNGGQAYFGKIVNLNERYIDLKDIYYISTNGQSNESQQSNISLIKLGSELHCPQDRMIINREQVLFWENLNDDGKVVNAIKQWQKENPNGQKCNNQTTHQQNTTAPSPSDSRSENSGPRNSQNNNAPNREPATNATDSPANNSQNSAAPTTPANNGSNTNPDQPVTTPAP